MQIDDKYAHGGNVYDKVDIMLDFSVNTNPLGMPREVRDALLKRVDEFSRYPDPHCRELRQAIALHEGVTEDYVLCGNGAADLIYRLCYATRPRSALLVAPTFSEYERALTQTDCRIVYHELNPEDDFLLDESIIDKIDENIELVFLCNPNNPTGRLIGKELLVQIADKCNKCGAFLVVDECFLDFTSGHTLTHRLCKMPKIAVIKAFTKTYSLAGLRLGYIISSDTALLKKMSMQAQVWSVSVPAQIAGVAAFSCDDWIKKTRELVEVEREFLANALCKLLDACGGKVYQSEANFILFRCNSPIYDSLMNKGILIRCAANFRGLGDFYYRIGVKTHEENLALIKAMTEVLHG